MEKDYHYFRDFLIEKQDNSIANYRLKYDFTGENMKTELIPYCPSPALRGAYPKGAPNTTSKFGLRKVIPDVGFGEGAPPKAWAGGAGRTVHQFALRKTITSAYG